MQNGREGHDGTFLVFEGIDGAGTTTQAERYASYLRARKRLAHVTHEPSSGPIGSQIRLVLGHRLTLPIGLRDEIMTLLFAADRIDHLQSEIIPHLRDGYVVISDRYDLSSIAYQSLGADGEAQQDSIRWIRECNRHARRPDATVVIHVSPEVAAARRRCRGGAAELFDEAEIQSKLAAAYRRAEELVPGDRILHVDGNGDVDSVTAAIVAALGPIVGT